jgi:signal transduction histidine kinase
MAAVDVPALVHESIKLLRVTLLAGCETVCEFPHEPVFAWGDRAELQQIILNLLINSAEARATTIRFRAAVVRCVPPAQAAGEPLDPGEYLELSVTDNGEGMAPEALARIFEPFYSTRFTGRGLGLPAAMGLVRAHGAQWRSRALRAKAPPFGCICRWRWARRRCPRRPRP